MTQNSEYAPKHYSEGEEKQRSSFWFSNGNNLLKLYTGYSILSFPYTFLDTGIVGSLLCLYLSAFMNLVGTTLLIKARNYYKHKNVINISEVVALTFGDSWIVWVETVIVLNNSITCMIYFIYMGE
mmetsp:Transcript_17918/g.12862  ORF Transcript_17918/g.12862 Transcript_17918/m.12862 type:complete len:126 (-) Transcript_17918:952-1329(-)